MIYTNYKGEQRSPSNNDIIIDRSGIWVAIIDPQNRILISHPEYDLNIMELPGGGIEAGEDKETSLLREIEEEAGVKFQTLTPSKRLTQHAKFLAWDKNEYWNYDQEYWVVKSNNNNHHFEGTRPTQEGAIGEWINLSSINTDNFHFTHFEALRKMGIL